MAQNLFILYMILRGVHCFTITTTEFEENDESFMFAPTDVSDVIQVLYNTPSVVYCATFCVIEKCIAYSFIKQHQMCRLYVDVICDKTQKKVHPTISFYRKNKDTATALQVLPNPVLKYTECKDAPGVGVYTIWPTPDQSVQAYCDYAGWTVFQRRCDGSQSFDKGWKEYKRGFGNANSEYWLGNEFIHLLSSNGPHELRVELESFDCRRKYAIYSTFRTENEAKKYMLTVTGYSGTAGDSMDFQDKPFMRNNGMFFSTKDMDNDASHQNHCAAIFKGAWWHRDCTTAHLNAIYTSTEYSGKNIFWNTFENPRTLLPLAKTTMALRRRS